MCHPCHVKAKGDFRGKSGPLRGPSERAVMTFFSSETLRFR